VGLFFCCTETNYRVSFYIKIRDSLVHSPDFYLMVFIHTSRIKIKKVLDITGG